MRRWRENANSYREGSLCLKVLAEAKAQPPSWILRTHVKKPGMLVPACNPPARDK